jgi:type II secretory pathway component HofQ
MWRLITTGFVLCALLVLGATPAAAEPPSAPRAKRGPAQTIDLDVHRADLRDVLRLLAHAGGVNLVYGEEIAGTVTLKLTAVPWERALWVVLSSKGLEMRREGNVIRVAPAAAFAEERERQLTAREQCLQRAPLRTRLIPVSHARAQDLLKYVAAKLTPRGSASVDERTNTLIVTDVDCP